MTKKRTRTVGDGNQSSQRGRPHGGGETAPVSTVSEAEVTESTCARCQSTRRSKYFGVTSQNYLDQRITRKRTTCLDCGQIRVDRFVERIKASAKK